MSLVISQTLPYTSAELQISDPKRWSRLFPLMRPSVKEVQTSSGIPIVIDTALVRSQKVLVAAIGNVGKFSSKILGESHLAAFAAVSDVASVSASDVMKVLTNGGFPIENGLVVVKVASKQDLRVFGGGVELDVVGEVTLDHVISLLSAVNAESKASIERTKTLLEHFVRWGTNTTSTFLVEKSGCGPSVDHTVEIAEFSSAKTAIDRDLGRLLGSIETSATDVVYSIHYSDINGLSRLENNILAHQISEYLAQKDLPSYITQSTIQDADPQARGWSISQCNIPITFLTPQLTRSNTLTNSSSPAPVSQYREGKSKIQFSDPQVRAIITAGCEGVIKNEPTITEYDTIVGDGDCGYTLRDGAIRVLSFISTADLSTLASTLSSLVDDLEVNIGGTSGALYCIFLSSLAQELWTAPTIPDALGGALEHLLKYTRARLGDRTCLDCLIPFVETLQKTGDNRKALSEAAKGVDSTKKLEAKLGRSSYLDEAATRGVPDPGAYGLLKLLEGMVGAN